MQVLAARRGEHLLSYGMHEYSLMSGLLSQIDALRLEHRADRVLSVRLIIGEFSGIEAQLLQTAFDDLAQGTATDGARLEIEERVLAARCHQCQSTFRVEEFQFSCPQCRSSAVKIEQGEELVLDTVTFEVDESHDE